MRKPNLFKLLYAFAFITFYTAASTLQAAIVWDYSPSTTGSSDSVSSWQNINSLQNVADHFSFPADAIVYGMDIYSTDALGEVGQLLTVRIWSGSGDLPGQLIDEFTVTLSEIDQDGVGTIPGLTRKHAEFAVPVFFASDTDYWIGMSSQGDTVATDVGQAGLNSNPPGDGAFAFFSGTTPPLALTPLGDMAFRLHGLSPVPDTPVDLNGTIKTIGGTDICAMVLASGQYMFSCDPTGSFALTELPRETDASIKLQIYADGFHPDIDNLYESGQHAITMEAAGTCPDYNQLPAPGSYPGSAGQWIDLSGHVLVGEDQQTAICAMVLANGQYMFSCNGQGDYVLNVPLDANGQAKLQVYAEGFAPTILYLDEFTAINDVKMARASECQ